MRIIPHPDLDAESDKFYPYLTRFSLISYEDLIQSKIRRTMFLERIREKSSAYMIQGFSGYTRRKETPWKPRTR
jgi:hypothetical protein